MNNNHGLRLLTTQVSLMQEIPKLVGHGYYHWVSGTVPMEKLEGLAKKFSDRYGTGLTAQQRSRRRSAGEAICRVLALPKTDGKSVDWLLLATDGSGPVNEREALFDLRKPDGFLIWNSDYVMKLSTRPRKFGGGTRYTWWMRVELESELDSRASALAQQGDAYRLRQHLDLMRRRPLFSGIRSQVFKITRRAEASWKRHQGDRPWPGNQDRLPWIGRFRSPNQNSVSETEK